MKIETILFRVGVPTHEGKIFTATELQAIAEAEPDKYRIDTDGNLRALLNDSETEALDRLLEGTAAAGLAGNEALEKFQEVLKYRERQGLPTSKNTTIETPLKKVPWVNMNVKKEKKEDLC